MTMAGRVRASVAEPLFLDGAIALVLTVMAQGQAGWSMSVIDRLLLIVMTCAVIARRRFVFWTALTVAAAAALMALTPQQPSVFGEYLAVILIAFTVAERLRLSLAIAGWAAIAGGILAHDLASTDYHSAGAIAGDLAMPLLAWGVGRIVAIQNGRADRAQRLVEQLEHDREELARLAVAAERAHLARELHDVVTHSVSVVVIQAQGAQRVLDGDQPEVRQSLHDIETAGRSALTDMRRLLGLLREDEQQASHAPQPGLADLPTLMTRVRSAGLAVDYTETGKPTVLAPGLELSAYRIAQETLTNALKYAPQSHVTVELRRQADALELCITDDGTAKSTDSVSGRGLLGIQERVALYGGVLTAGPLPERGFQVHARLPTQHSPPTGEASS